MNRHAFWLFAAIALIPCPAAAQGPSGWRFAATFYAWPSNLKGDVNTSEATHPVKVDLSHFDVLDHLKFAAFGSLEARKDRLVVLSDLTYAKLGASTGIEVRDVDLIDVELNAATFTATLLGGYRVAEGQFDIDLLAGGRLVINSTDLVLSGPQRTVEGEVTETWVDAIIATQIGVPVSSKTSLSLYGDMGGGASDFTWQLSAGVSHRVSERWALTAGWRYYSVDYDKGAFLYDVTQHGPVIGARFEF